MVQLHRQQRIQKTAKLPPQIFKIGQKVKVVKHYPKRAKHRYPALGPYTIVKRISTSGYLLKHDISGKELEAPSLWIQPLHTRETDGTVETASAKEPKTNETSDDEETTDDETERKEVEQATEAPPQHKKPRLLARIKSYNTVSKPKDIEIEATTGAMIATKDGQAARIGEITRDLGADWEVQWYGTTTRKTSPRRRWKFYPGWETEEGTIEYRKSQTGTGRPAIAQIGKDEVILAFTSLTLQAAIPQQVLTKLESLHLA